MTIREFKVQSNQLIKGDGFNIYHIFSPQDAILVVRKNKHGAARMITNGKDAYAVDSDILHSQIREELKMYGKDLSGYYNTQVFVENKDGLWTIESVEIRYEDGTSEKAIKKFFRMS